MFLCVDETLVLRSKVLKSIFLFSELITKIICRTTLLVMLFESMGVDVVETLVLTSEVLQSIGLISNLMDKRGHECRDRSAI